MTNFILSRGNKVCYQRSARVHTKTPKTYTSLCKMFLRWGRSNIRETFHTGRFVFSRFRAEPKLGIRFNFVMGALGLVAPYPFLVIAFILALCLPAVFGLKLLTACICGSLFTVVFCAARERKSNGLFGIPYAFYSTFLLWWIWPYALFTCHKSVWLTRVSCGASVSQTAIELGSRAHPTMEEENQKLHIFTESINQTTVAAIHEEGHCVP